MIPFPNSQPFCLLLVSSISISFEITEPSWKWHITPILLAESQHITACLVCSNVVELLFFVEPPESNLSLLCSSQSISSFNPLPFHIIGEVSNWPDSSMGWLISTLFIPSSFPCSGLAAFELSFCFLHHVCLEYTFQVRAGPFVLGPISLFLLYVRLHIGVISKAHC